MKKETIINLVKHLISNKKNQISDIEIDVSGISACRFLFSGEFGYEMVSWLPFLTYISKTTELKLKTASRLGSENFYKTISADHIEIPNELLGDMWGNLDCINEFQKRISDRIISPSNELVGEGKNIIIGSYKWENKDIHTPIKTNYYLSPIFENKNKLLKILGIDTLKCKNIVVVNNKSHYNWNDTSVKNFYTQEELSAIVNYFLNKQSIVIYNNPNDKIFDNSSLAAENIYSYYHENQNYFDLNNFDNDDISLRNQLQIEAWGLASIIIGCHGGSVYIPSIMGKKQYVLMRKGDYIDFMELNRVFNANCICVYEINQIFAAEEYIKC